MVKIAVTGGIACGKSLVGSFLADEGVAVCDADKLAHELMRPGSPVFRKLVAKFGRDILKPNGIIDRERLGRRVFSNLHELAALNAIVHPEVKKAWQKWLRDQESGVRSQESGKKNAECRMPTRASQSSIAQFGNLKSKIGNVKAVIVPLLYEAGEAEGWDAVVCVSASETAQIRRLKRKGLSELEAEKRIAAQIPVVSKVALADYVIDNNGTKDLLKEQTTKVLQNVLEK